ncbi:Ger(x)C family spore germination protein [Bacillus sp. JJ1533]|uniref:Ger(x)C family spore germination protein n=1 Tax=Bacillus sp. JJ1533 TaxID=3122959 RepID=UPI0030003A07
MGIWRKSLIVVIVFVCILSLVGCSRTKIVDKLSIIHVFGFDIDDNGKIIGTALFPEYTKSKGSDKSQYLEQKTDAVALLRSQMSTHTDTPVALSKIRVLVFGEEFAKAGISDVVERLLLTPQIATNIQIAVSTNSAKETLTTLKKGDLTLADKIKQNMIGQQIPRMNLHVFLNHFYGEGMDPYVPMLNIDENDKIQVERVGIFKDDKLKLHLNEKETFIFSILEDYRTQAIYEIPLDNNNRKDVILIQGFRNKAKWDWVKTEQQLNLSLRLIWTITHHPDRFNLENPQDLENIKKMIKENVLKDIEELLNTFKENGVDPLGIGNIVRSQDRNWDKTSFYEQYPTLPINVDLKLKIIHSGLQG